MDACQPLKHWKGKKALRRKSHNYLLNISYMSEAGEDGREGIYNLSPLHIIKWVMLFYRWGSVTAQFGELSKEFSATCCLFSAPNILSIQFWNSSLSPYFSSILRNLWPVHPSLVSQLKTFFSLLSLLPSLNALVGHFILHCFPLTTYAQLSFTKLLRPTKMNTFKCYHHHYYPFPQARF